MPARVVRSEINASESLSRVSESAELMFRALILAVDDFGRLDARPKILKADLFPMRDSMTAERIESLLEELHAEGCVRVYEVDGRRYLVLTGWEKHRSNGKRAKDSKFPDPPEASEDFLGSPRIPEDPQKIRPSDVWRVASSERRVAREEERAPRDGATPSPLLRLLKNLPGDEAEKLAFLADEGPQIEVDSAESGKSVAQVTVRYYRSYLKRGRIHQNAAEEAIRAAKRKAWQEQHGAAYDEALRESEGVI